LPFVLVVEVAIRGHGGEPLRAGVNRTYQDLAAHYGTIIMRGASLETGDRAPRWSRKKRRR
jgi:hypothetical protein